jgi:hypothetical protein
MRLRALLVSPVLIAVLALAGCNNGSSGSTHQQPSSPGVSKSGSAPSPSCTIPQNNGGDHDADNNGGPDDGDGCDV